MSEEVASDMIHYKERHIFFYIYDMENIIENKKCFAETYEKKNVDNKDIHIIIDA